MSDTTMSRILLRIFWMLGGIFAVVSGDLEPTFNRCCNHGVNWGSEGRQCNTFQAPIAGVPNPQQAICLTVVQICCLRRHRELQCEAGKVAARQDRECIVTPVIGGEAFKDCCEACKLGLVSGTMNLGCTMKNYKFGLPWDEAYQSCCVQTIGAAGRRNQAQFGIPTNQVPESPPSYLSQDEQDPLENLCNIFPGQLCAHICLPSPGSYSCSCREGFELMADRKSCQLIGQGNDRCVNDNPCGQICKDTGTGIICSCRSGYKLGLDQKSCIDIDECEVGSHNCDPDSTICVNEEDGFKCIPNEGPSSRTAFIQETAKCPRGFTFNPRSSACDDIDECSSPVSCSSPMICQNTIGSYLCVATSTKNCPPGYSFDSAINSCKDINECLNDPCKTEERCINTLGSFSCQGEKRVQQVLDCPSGYRFNTNTKSCEDINECAEETHNCTVGYEDCVNTLGGYSCKPLPPCPDGFRREFTTGRCFDIDECSEGLDDCNTEKTLCVNSYGGFTCRPFPVCPPGHRYIVEARTCEDVDECKEGTDNCDRDREMCSNSIGSFKCTENKANCPSGHRFNPLTRNCEDIDECAENTFFCESYEECVNERGGYRCISESSSLKDAKVVTTTIEPEPKRSCPSGYRFSDLSRRCVDINECLEANPCNSETQTCENKVGSYTCQCKHGLRLNPTTRACDDINECSINIHNCLPTQRCDNTIGSFTCTRITSCGTGYTFNSQSGKCEDDDECTEGLDDCALLGPSWVCRNTVGSFRCEKKRCPSGQRLARDGTCITPAEKCTTGYKIGPNWKCVDIDECITNPCQRNSKCVNTPGSYRCVSNLPQCGSGYESNEYGQCVDVDECITGHHDCRSGQACHNRAGGYTCGCMNGFSLNPITKECEDIDECRDRVCDTSTSTCLNTPGSYRCECREGFRKKSENQCIDIDECAETERLCQHRCVNSWGSFKCLCEQGYTLAPDNRACYDVDECEQYRERGRNLCVGQCVNELGSYKCTCPSGYKLAPDGRTCLDIDECAQGNVCQPEETCLNTRGSYRCNSINCPSNYIRDPDHKNRCKRTSVECLSSDNECLRRPISFSYNYLTFTSRIHVPRSTGQLDIFTMRGPVWPTSSVKFDLKFVDTRAPKGVEQAAEEYFTVRRVGFNQCILSLAKAVEGPQDIELHLSMDMYHNGALAGVAVARIYIFVSQYEF
ncbi:fibulin-1-like isoform X14 [Artemia franciscana]|uniref:fibulin-1-like isoform X14 n=1 Tax=Artemia franciscana TaxID=6661 RepID=UPI0032DB3348